MAIDRVKKVWFLIERPELDRFIQSLARSKTTHIIDLSGEKGGELPPEHSPTGAAAAAHAENEMHRLARALDIIDSFKKPQKSLAENLVTLPLEMTRKEFDSAVKRVDVDEVFDTVTASAKEHAVIQKRIEHAKARIAQLEPWAAFEAPPALKRSKAVLGAVPAKFSEPLIQAAAEAEIAVKALVTEKARTLFAVTYPLEGADAAQAILASHGFQPLDVHEGAGKISAMIAVLEKQIAADQKSAEAPAAKIIEYAGKRNDILAAHAYWQTEHERYQAFTKAYFSRRAVILGGWVRVKELAALEALINKDFPAVGVITEDPKPEDDVPVSLGGSKIVRPAQFLTALFGLPSYYAFDPSAFILFTFLIFFGICFGDVLYGLVLVALGWWLAKKAGNNKGVARLFTLVSIGGAFSIIVGVLTNSWAADLFNYFGQGNPLAKMAASLAVFDPMAKPVIGLLIALGIGVMNQFYAITMLMYREWRKNNKVGALLDGGLWLIFLPGLILVLAGVMVEVPKSITTTGLVMLAVSAAGLILTQGRNEPSFIGKAVTGFVSLYGIVGTYGTTSFIGDVLSYSRLLALGLTTMVVGMAANMIGSLIQQQVPYVGFILAVILLIIFHFGNIVISALGAFVHALRLIFVEFFTKFYEGGGKPFTPLGVPRTVRVIED